MSIGKMKKLEKILSAENTRGKQTSFWKPQKSIEKQIMQQEYKVIEIFPKQKSIARASLQHEI